MPEDDQQALARLVLESDELRELDRLLGGFNVFDALRVGRAEVRHSNFLAWLLDPSESHCLGSTFLTPLVSELCRLLGISPQPILASALSARIMRESNRIDVLIIFDAARTVIAIENKVDASEHTDQLGRYSRTLEAIFPGWTHIKVYLTPKGELPSQSDWHAFGYRDIHRLVADATTLAKPHVQSDVLTFIEHYQRLLRSWYMDDPRVKELCRAIFAKHRRAMELLVRNAPTPERDFFDRVALLMRERLPEWQVLSSTSEFLNIAPASWAQLVPHVGKERTLPPWAWLIYSVVISDAGVKLVLYRGPVSDSAIEQRIVRALYDPSHDFDFRKPGKGREPRWHRLRSTKICEWSNQWDDAQAADAARRTLQTIQGTASLNAKFEAVVRSACTS